MNLLNLNGKSYVVETHDDLRKALYLSGMDEIYDTICYIDDNNDDEVAIWKDVADEWEMVADGYHSALNTIYNEVEELQSMLLECQKLKNRKEIMQCVNNIIIEVNNVL